MSDVVNPVLQEWVMCLNWKEQTGLISAIRGYDGVYKVSSKSGDILKRITKMIRFLVIKNADKNTKFMSDEIISIESLKDYMDDILLNVDTHFIEHMLKAIKIIKDKHPSNYVRLFYKNLYDEITSLIEIYDRKIELETDKFFHVKTDNALESIPDTVESLNDKTDKCPAEKIKDTNTTDDKASTDYINRWTDSNPLDVSSDKRNKTENLDNLIASKIKSDIVGDIDDLGKILDRTCLPHDSDEYINIEKLNIALVQFIEGKSNEILGATFHTFLKRDIFREADSRCYSSVRYSLAVYNNDTDEYLWVSKDKEFGNAMNQCINVIKKYTDIKHHSLISKIHDVVSYWKNTPVAEEDHKREIQNDRA